MYNKNASNKEIYETHNSLIINDNKFLPWKKTNTDVSWKCKDIEIFLMNMDYWLVKYPDGEFSISIPDYQSLINLVTLTVKPNLEKESMQSGFTLNEKHFVIYPSLKKSCYPDVSPTFFVDEKKRTSSDAHIEAEAQYQKLIAKPIELEPISVIFEDILEIAKKYFLYDEEYGIYINNIFEKDIEKLQIIRDLIHILPKSLLFNAFGLNSNYTFKDFADILNVWMHNSPDLLPIELLKLVVDFTCKTWDVKSYFLLDSLDEREKIRVSLENLQNKLQSSIDLLK